MITIPVNIATEDELSENTLKRLLRYINRGFSIGTSFRRGGNGFLKRTINGWNRAAATIPIVVLTDLDTAECPVELINNWLRQPPHPNLMLRIAVREVESWLLADRNSLASYLKVKTRLLSPNPDELHDPKATLVELAKTSQSADIRSRIVPKRGSTAKQGPDYNSCLSTFVEMNWDIGSAAIGSPSLMRTIKRFYNFFPTWH